MLKKILLVNLLLCVVFQVKAQTSEPVSDSVYTRYKWEIGTDLLWLVNKNTAPSSIMLRLHKDNLTAYRFRVGGNYIENTNPLGGGKVYAGNTGLNKTELNLLLNLGKEWQKQFGHFWGLYGSDIFFSYNLIRSEINIEPGNKYYPITKDIKIGISPFIGGEYFIDPHISISCESHLNLGYQQNKITRLDFSIPNQPFDETPLQIKKDKFLKSEFLPIYIINLNYHF